MSQEFSDFFEAELPPRDDAWQISSDGEADWAVMKIQEAQAEVSHHEAERAKALARWDAYVEAATREAQRTRQFFEGKLHGYLLALQERGKLGTKKSYQLPSARLQLRTVGPQFEIVNAEAFLAWCEEHDLTEVVVKPKWGEAKKRLSPRGDGGIEAIDPQTGDVVDEAVPGLIVVRQEMESFSVVFPKEDKVGEP